MEQSGGWFLSVCLVGEILGWKRCERKVERKWVLMWVFDEEKIGETQMFSPLTQQNIFSQIREKSGEKKADEKNGPIKNPCAKHKVCHFLFLMFSS